MSDPRFARLSQKTVFVAAPGDVAYLREAVRQELADLERRTADDHGIVPFLWEIDKAEDGFSPYVPAQADLPLPSDPNCVAVVCIFGERLGTPLPDDFPLEPLRSSWALREESSYRLVHGWPKPRDEGDLGPVNAFPLTGSTFEYLTAVESETRPPLLLLFVGDSSLFQDEVQLLNRKWGMWRLRRAARRRFGDDEEGYDDWKRREHRPQLTWLASFLGYLRFDRGVFLDVVETEEEARRKIRQFLQRSLDLRVIATDRPPFKHLEAYEVADNPFFFGRKALRERALREIETLLHGPDRLPFYGVTGASGAGKSSFLRAGLVARLSHSLSMGSFVSLVVKPSELVTGSEDPLDRLLTELETTLEQPSATLPRSDPQAAAERLAEILETDDRAELRLVLGLDQLEECLDELASRSHTDSEPLDRWHGLIELLDHAVRGRRVLVLYTVPHNRLGKLHENAVLSRLFHGGDCLALPFPDTELDDIIQQPFRLQQLELERDLAEHLERSIRTLAVGNPAILPLVSVVLSRIYEHWQSPEAAVPAADPGSGEARAERLDLSGTPELSDPLDPSDPMLVRRQFSGTRASGSSAVLSRRSRILTLEEYRPLTDLAGCIELLGDRSLEQAKKDGGGRGDQERLLGRLLRRLVRRSASAPDTFDLRPAALPADLAASPLVSALRANRLIVEESWQRVRLVHESVLSHWSQAREWTEEERHRIRARSQLQFTVGSWEEQGRGDELLLGLGDNVLGLCADLLLHWGDDLVPTDPDEEVDPDDARFFDFLVAALQTHPRPAARVPGSENGSTHLHAAAFAGATDLVRLYLELEPETVDLLRPDGRSPLFVAAATNRSDIVDLLLDHGAEIDRRDREGATPLLLATFLGQTRAVEALLDRGADPRIASGSHGYEALLSAAAQGHEAIVARLLADERVDPNATLDTGASALLLAAYNGHVSVVRTLLTNPRVDPNAQARDGYTPLQSAAHQGQRDVVALLLQDPRVVLSLESDGAVDRNPLLLAAQEGHDSVVEVLLNDSRIDPELRDSAGRAARTVAHRGSSERIAKHLLAAGIEIPTSFWDRLDRDPEGHVLKILSVDPEALYQALTDSLEPEPALDWGIPPALDGAWTPVAPPQAAELLTRVCSVLPVGFGDGVERLEALRRLSPSFYDETTLYEARARCRDGSAGVLTFLEHPQGLTVLDGTSPPIHKLNATLPLKLEGEPRARDYLRFFCSMVTGEEGAFTLVEDPRRLFWSDGEREKTARPAAEPHVQPLRLLAPPGEEEEGKRGTETWLFTSVVRYSDALFRTRFEVAPTGMIEMLDDEPLVAELGLDAEVFTAGLRRLVTVKREPDQAPRPHDPDPKGPTRSQRALQTLYGLKKAVGGDPFVTLLQARILANVFLHPDVSTDARARTFGIAPDRLTEELRQLERRGALTLAEGRAGSKARIHIPEERRVFLEEAVETMHDPSRIDVFLDRMGGFMRGVPEPHRNLGGALYVAEIHDRGRDGRSTEDHDLSATIHPDNPEALWDTVEQLKSHEVVISDDDDSPPPRDTPLQDR